MNLKWSLSNSPDKIKKPQSRYVAFSGYMEVPDDLDINQASKALRESLKEAEQSMSTFGGDAVNET